MWYTGCHGNYMHTCIHTSGTDETKCIGWLYVCLPPFLSSHPPEPAGRTWSKGSSHVSIHHKHTINIQKKTCRKCCMGQKPPRRRRYWQVKEPKVHFDTQPWADAVRLVPQFCTLTFVNLCLSLSTAVELATGHNVRLYFEKPDENGWIKVECLVVFIWYVWSLMCSTQGLAGRHKPALAVSNHLESHSPIIQ